MKSVFMVAEKPSLSASLATILSNGKCSTRKGMNGSCSVHEWTGTFQNSPAKLKMTSVCGHVMSLDFISKYNNWDRVDPVELFSCATEKKEAMAKLRMPQFLAQEARTFDILVLWLDCDKEGENICYEVMDCVSRSMNGNVYSDAVTYRAKFSAITEKDIKAAFANLGRPNENEARSVDARQELDLRIGCAFTRFQTRFFQGKYGDLDASLISYGPCQTPTLGFCVQRHDQIQTFKPETYWCVATSVESSEGGASIALQWSRVRCFDRDVATMFASAVRDCSYLQVVSVTRKEKTKARPAALNTVELMRVASASLGMGPHHAMQIAEKLYIQGYISYPRTETTAYPEAFDLAEVLRQQTGCPDWGKEASQVLRDGVTRPRSGKDVGDHPPITPTRAADRTDLDGDAWRIYDYIVRHFIASIARDCKYITTTATLTGGGESFTLSANAVTDPGWTALMPWHAVGKGSGEQGVLAPPTFAQGEQLKLLDCKLTEHQTQPPDYITESELITLMEKHGIGTDASIPVHINNICQRNYVNVTSSGRRLVPTSLGIVLVHGYQKIDPQLVLPTMRSAVEEQLNLIAAGKANFTAVLRHTVEIFRLKFQYFVLNIEGMDQLFEVTFSSLSDSGKSFSRCGKCRRYMKYIQAKPARLHCPQCDETYNVPQAGNIRLFRELKCPLDDFELLSWSMGAKGRSYPFCPYCYNNTPFPDMKKGTGCNGCSHPTCAYSLNTNGVSSCVECDVGVLVLDPSSGPKWKLGCNKCDVIVQLFEDAQRVTVLETSCDDCGVQHLSVRYASDKNKLPAGTGTEANGCIFCSEILTPLVEKRKAKQFCSTGGGRGRGGRSRGGRGRGGRGGGNRVPKDKMAQLAAYFV